MPVLVGPLRRDLRLHAASSWITTEDSNPLFQVSSLYQDEGVERLQSPNAATGKPLKKKTCTAAGTLLEVPLTPRESCAAPPQPICGHVSSRRVRCNVRFGRSEGSLRQARGRAAASG